MKLSSHPTNSHYFSSSPLPPSAYFRDAVTLEVNKKSLSMVTGDGVFSKNQLDAGSRVLLQSFFLAHTPQTATTICDLGCGWGAIGCFLAAHFPESHIAMCDINLRAVVLAHFNAQQNQLSNVSTWCGDGLAAVRAEYFDHVVCNPPIRAGNATIAQLFLDAERCLKSQGVLTVVIRTAQGAKSWHKKLSAQFGGCETIVIENGYRVLQCIK